MSYFLSYHFPSLLIIRCTLLPFQTEANQYYTLQEVGCDTSCIEYLATLKSVSSLNVPAQTKLTSSSEYKFFGSFM